MLFKDEYWYLVRRVAPNHNAWHDVNDDALGTAEDYGIETENQAYICKLINFYNSIL